ncbi:MAG TPA: alpha/beta hydrolase-fold protein [Gemmatimonadales bacterium]|nr:alpha/beta hydrolase-fold protein [Gemmatimonadales bacterium]
MQRIVQRAVLVVGSFVLSACGRAPRVAAPQVAELRTDTLQSAVFHNERLLRVLVPPGYDAAQNRGRRYPVLYLNDGQDLFDTATANLGTGEWRVDETVDSLLAAKAIVPLIVVGIDNVGPQERFREYFPYHDEYLQPPVPAEGDRYPAFLDEVRAFVNARYRTDTAPSATGIGGSSAGGLAALYAAVKRPGVFGRLLIESPSVYVDDYHVLREAAPVREWPGRIYLGVGTNERNAATCPPDTGGTPELVGDVLRLRGVLESAGVDSSRIRTVITPCGRHRAAAWAARLPLALTFLYGGSEDLPSD